MAAPIDDVSKLPGETLHDQLGKKIGTIKDVYEADGGDAPMWVTVEASTGLLASRTVFIPIARIKQEDDQFRVPYSATHIEAAPEVESVDELSEEEDRKLRDYYAIDLADQEIRSGSDSYATRVPDEGGPVHRAS